MSAQRARPPAGQMETLSGEMETLRGVLHQRLATAVDDILGEFGRTVARYRDQIDRQRRQLDGLKAEEQRARSRSAERLQDDKEIKSEPNGAADPAESSDTEDSGDDWSATGPLEPAAAAAGGAGRAAPPGPFGCGESFPSSCFLLAHGAAPPRACVLRGERPEKPRRRLRGHEEEAPFRCGVCGRSFTLRGNLRTHTRIHSGERPHGCTVCGKSFGRRATLVRHVRSHTGEKPFACAHCGRGFVEKGNLTVHLRTHAGIQGPHAAGTLGPHAGIQGPHAAGIQGPHAAGTLGPHAGIQGPHAAGTLGPHAAGTQGPHIDLHHALDVIRQPPDAHWTCLK